MIMGFQIFIENLMQMQSFSDTDNRPKFIERLHLQWNLSNHLYDYDQH